MVYVMDKAFWSTIDYFLVVEFWGSQKLHTDFRLCSRLAPLTPHIQGSTVFYFTGNMESSEVRAERDLLLPGYLVQLLYLTNEELETSRWSDLSKAPQLASGRTNLRPLRARCLDLCPAHSCHRVTGTTQATAHLWQEIMDLEALVTLCHHCCAALQAAQTSGVWDRLVRDEDRCWCWGTPLETYGWSSRALDIVTWRHQSFPDDALESTFFSSPTAIKTMGR